MHGIDGIDHFPTTVQLRMYVLPLTVLQVDRMQSTLGMTLPLVTNNTIYIVTCWWELTDKRTPRLHDSTLMELVFVCQSM